MNAARIERWVWILVYAGLAALGVGLAVQRADAGLGWTIVVAGAALVALGAFMIWLRSRIRTDDSSSNVSSSSISSSKREAP